MYISAGAQGDWKKASRYPGVRAGSKMSDVVVRTALGPL